MVVVSYCRGRPRLVLVNCLEGLSLPRNSATINWPAQHDLVVDWAVKLQHKTNNFLSHFSVRPTKTHGQCVHQIQAASTYLFLYFSSFFCLSSQQTLKKITSTKIVSTYLWWLLLGLCELCSLSAIFIFAEYIYVGQSWTSDFSLCLEDFLMDKCHNWNIGSMWCKDLPHKMYVGQWPTFHGPVILSYVLKTFWWRNVVCCTEDIDSVQHYVWPTNIHIGQWPIFCDTV